MNAPEVKTEKPRFDLRVHIRDSKTGRITRVQPYQRIVRDGQVRFVRDGVEFYPNGLPVDPNKVLQISAKKIPDNNAFAEEDKKYTTPVMNEINQARAEMIQDMNQFKTDLLENVKQEISGLFMALREQAPAADKAEKPKIVNPKG